MKQSRFELEECAREELLLLIWQLSSKLKRKNEQISNVRSKLVRMKSEVALIQQLILTQRQRIVSLYPTRSGLGSDI